MIQKELYKIYHFLYELIPTCINCKMSGLPFDPTWVIKGKPRIITRKWYDRFFRHLYGGKLIIGKGFHCNNNVTSNTIGLIQPCVFNIAQPDCVLKIGNNVGISGSSICASRSVTIGDNVLIGSGCIITDTLTALLIAILIQVKIKSFAHCTDPLLYVRNSTRRVGTVLSYISL